MYINAEFRGNPSCEKHIFTQRVSYTIKERFYVYLDTEKAFDTINITLLMYNLRRMDISGSLYTTISSIYDT